MPAFTRARPNPRTVHLLSPERRPNVIRATADIDHALPAGASCSAARDAAAAAADVNGLNQQMLLSPGAAPICPFACHAPNPAPICCCRYAPIADAGTSTFLLMLLLMPYYIVFFFFSSLESLQPPRRRVDGCRIMRGA